MVRVSVFYPYKPGARFDVDYYLRRHMTRSVELLGPHMKEISTEIGVAGGIPGQPAPFAAISSFTCNSVEEFTSIFLQHADELQGDIPNYTDIAPVIQVSEVVVLRLD
jgi:uncharacterized protein (TIGR02118 family)